jgi:DNA-binding IclR family transcriptional regulator
MLVRLSNRDHAPLIVRGMEVGRLNMFGSATGMAYLAFCSRDERNAIISRLAIDQDRENELARDRILLEQNLAEIRSRGYAQQDWSLGEIKQARAVPVYSGDDLTACLTVFTLKEAVSSNQFNQDILPSLLDAAARIRVNLTM